jgi:Na+-driven multidrug efflux pump
MLPSSSILICRRGFPADKEGIYLAGRKFIFQTMLLMGIFIILLAPYLIKIFTLDSQVVKFGSLYFRTTALTYCFLGTGLLANAVFQGMGRGYPAFVNIFARLLGFQVTGAFAFTLYLGMGAWGAWGAVALANVGYGVISSLWLRSHLTQKLKIVSEKT